MVLPASQGPSRPVAEGSWYINAPAPFLVGRMAEAWSTRDPEVPSGMKLHFPIVVTGLIKARFSASSPSLPNYPSLLAPHPDPLGPPK